ncbi:hypothetical protein IAS59_005800 [Cryptococcus gattii]
METADPHNSQDFEKARPKDSRRFWRGSGQGQVIYCALLRCCSVFKHEQCITYISINVIFRTLERPST